MSYMTYMTYMTLRSRCRRSQLWGPAEATSNGEVRAGPMRNLEIRADRPGRLNRSRPVPMLGNLSQTLRSPVSIPGEFVVTGATHDRVKSGRMNLVSKSGPCQLYPGRRESRGRIRYGILIRNGK